MGAVLRAKHQRIGHFALRGTEAVKDKKMVLGWHHSPGTRYIHKKSRVISDPALFGRCAGNLPTHTLLLLKVGTTPSQNDEEARKKVPTVITHGYLLQEVLIGLWGKATIRRQGTSTLHSLRRLGVLPNLYKAVT